MSGLYGSLSVALSSLMANQQAMETSANNVANANTPGFSRQRPVFEPGDPVIVGSLSYGTGVSLEKLESLRDPILEIRIAQETQQQGKLDASNSALQQIQIMFSSAESGIGDAITKFFDTLQQLSTDPSNLALRQGVLTAAGNLANAFNQTAANLDSQRANLDLNVTQTVNEVNTLTGQIAALNQQITNLENVNEDASAFLDKRTNLIRQLSGLVDVSVIQTDHGISLTTSNGTPLVTEGTSFPLTTALGSGAQQHVFSQTKDVTDFFTGGKLGGLLEVRDSSIPALQGNLDQLAAGLATALNTAHSAGFDLNGDPGVDLFVAPPTGGVGAAAGMAVAFTDPALIAASSDGTPGSNGNLAALSAVHDSSVVGGQKPLDFYSRIVFQIGNDVSNSSADLDAANLILQQLDDERASVSGVSLDEEAANMVRYQSAYQAAARVVTTVNEMLDAAVNLGRY